MKENQKNTAIDLWKFLFVIVIGIGSLNKIVWQNSGEELLFTGRNFLMFFVFLAGYKLMKHYKENKNSKKQTKDQVWVYVKNLISRFYPILLICVLLAFIVQNAIQGVMLKDWLYNFMNSIYEFIGLAQIGLFENTGLWNEPLWIIPPIILFSYILYVILNKSEELFKVISIILIITIYSNIIITNDLTKILANMCIGALSYYLVDYFQKKKFNETLMMTFSVLHISLAMLLIYIMINGQNWFDNVNYLFLWLFLIVLLINKDYISVLYNKSIICEALGKISLYYYAIFIVFIYLIAYLYPEMTYKVSIIFNILFSMCGAYLLMYVDDYVITPIFREKRINKKKKS